MYLPLRGSQRNSRSPKLRISLKVKLGLLITLLIVLSVLLVGDYLLKQAESSLTAEITKRGFTIANYLAASAKNPLVTRDGGVTLIASARPKPSRKTNSVSSGIKRSCRNLPIPTLFIQVSRTRQSSGSSVCPRPGDLDYCWKRCTSLL